MAFIVRRITGKPTHIAWKGKGLVVGREAVLIPVFVHGSAEGH